VTDDNQVLEIVKDSLVRRMRTMFSLYYDAVDTMSLEQVNHVDQPGRLPIAFSLFHYVNIHDGTFVMLSGQPRIWNEEWHDRVQPAIGEHGKGHPMAEMSNQRIGDYDGFKEYQRAVFGRTQAHLEGIDPSDFLRVIFAKPYPDAIAGTYSARCAGDVGITVLDGYECWLYQHGLRHMGEIELARGFQGLSGMTA
jgi:hypothetical protein